MRILVVDDEFVALTKMMTMLGPLGECDAATSGRQALDMFREALGRVNPYDLVTIDIDMPGMSGLMLLRLLCEAEQLQNTQPAKKLVVSAASTPANVSQAAMHHCDGFLVKPVQKQKLMAKLVELKLIMAEQAVGPQ